MNKIAALLLLVASTASAQTIRFGIRDGTNSWESVLVANTNLIARLWEWSESQTAVGSNRAERLAILLRDHARAQARAAWRSRKLQERLEELATQEGE